ncbi:type II toxin-antitoxin system RelE family toxin [Methylomonas sp. MgM2]
MAYNIILKPSAQKSILKLPKTVQTRILDAIQSLAENPLPNGAKKLRGPTDLWRIRIGDYRVIYSIDAGILEVHVLVVGHRSSVYN